LVKVGPKHWERYGLKSWIEAAKKRLHHNVLAIALANKLARISASHSRIGRRSAPRMRWTSDFFITETTIAENRCTSILFVRPRRGPFFRPGHRSRSRRAQGRSSLAAFAATARLGLDCLEHGGTLAWNGIAFLAWLELAVSGDYGRRARATSWRSVTRRLQASPDCLFCPAG
jgi:hypothetical protein